MKEPSKEAMTDMLLAIVGNELAHDLTNVKDNVEALRKALLYLIFLSQDRVSPAGYNFIQYLLTNFPAIKDYKGQVEYPFLFQETIKNALLDNGDSQVTLKSSFFEKLDEHMEQSNLKGGKLSHDFFEKIEKFFDTYSAN